VEERAREHVKEEWRQTTKKAGHETEKWRQGDAGAGGEGAEETKW
jgi:hypothetical protein